MTEKKKKKITKSIQDKLGKENTSLIADDLGKLITDNATMNKDLKGRDERISKLEQDKEALITSNGNLLQQVVMGDDSSLINTNEIMRIDNIEGTWWIYNGTPIKQSKNKNKWLKFRSRKKRIIY